MSTDALLLDKIRALLAEPRLQGIDINSSELIDCHRQILFNKKILRQVFTEFFELCMALDQKHLKGQGLQVEIGAGSSFFKDIYPSVISTNIKPASHIDMVVDAMEMPFGENSVRSFYCINCFHHFPDPNQFFMELNRVLEPGGGCIIIEPYYGPLAEEFYSRVFTTEHFNKRQRHWRQGGDEFNIMTGANQALSYIVFERDYQKFKDLHPGLEVVQRQILDNYLRYFLSGGLNFRQLVPDFLLPLIKGIEGLLKPFHKYLALHYALVIRKDFE